MGLRFSKRIRRRETTPNVSETAATPPVKTVTVAEPEIAAEPVEYVDTGESPMSSSSLFSSPAPQASISEPTPPIVNRDSEMAVILPPERLHANPAPSGSIESERSDGAEIEKIGILAPQLVVLTKELLMVIWEVSRTQGVWGLVRASFWLSIAITEGVWKILKGWISGVIPP